QRESWRRRLGQALRDRPRAVDRRICSAYGRCRASLLPRVQYLATNAGYADHADGDRANSLALTAAWGDFTLHGIYSARTKNVPTASFDTVFNGGREKIFDGRDWLDLQFTKELGRSLEV